MFLFISMAPPVLTLMFFNLLLYLPSPNFPPILLFGFDVKQFLKVKFVVYYVMTKMGANE